MHVCTCVYVFNQFVLYSNWCISLLHNIFQSLVQSCRSFHRCLTTPPPPTPHLFSCLQNIKRRCVFISIHQTIPGNKRFFFKSQFTAQCYYVRELAFFPGFVWYIIESDSACGCGVFLQSVTIQKIHADKYKNIFH